MIAADGSTSFSTIEMRGFLCGIVHSRLQLLDALSLFLIAKCLRVRMKESPRMQDVHAVCHARTMFYPGDARQFLEAVLNIPEKLRNLARKAVGGPQRTAQQRLLASDGTGPSGLRAAKF